MKHVFILNPKAGKYNVEILRNKIETVFSEYDYVIEVTKKAKDATEIAKRYAQTGLDLCLYACGGDGTIHEVVNGMYPYANAKLAIFPIGTGNDFIKSFSEYTKADFLNMEYYKEALYVPCDLLKVGEYVGINTASLGLDAEVAKNVEHFKSLPLLHGVVPYYLSLLYSLSKRIAQEYTIIIDGKPLKKDMYSFIVAGNGKYYGGGFCPSPKARINDKEMDLCLIKQVTRKKIIRLSGKYKKGTHTDYTDIVHVQKAKQMQVVCSDKVLVNIDGEIITMVNPTINILPHQIMLCLPNKK